MLSPEQDQINRRQARLKHQQNKGVRSKTYLLQTNDHARIDFLCDLKNMTRGEVVTMLLDCWYDKNN